jgi:hypothetical protein
VPDPPPPILAYETPAARPPDPLRAPQWSYAAGALLGLAVMFYVQIFRTPGPEAFACLVGSPLALLWGAGSAGIGMRTRLGQIESDAVTTSPWLALALGVGWPLLLLVPVGEYLEAAMFVVMIAVPYFSALLIVRRRK